MHLKALPTVRSASLSIFFNVAKAIEEKKKDLDRIPDAGGTIAWVIVILGLIGLFLVFVRAIILMLAGSGSSSTVDNVSLTSLRKT